MAKEFDILGVHADTKKKIKVKAALEGKSMAELVDEAFNDDDLDLEGNLERLEEESEDFFNL